jgi:adenylate kinase
MQHALTVIFIGPQGSGKGTQIERLRAAMIQKDPVRRVVDIQTGRRFRSLAARSETFAEKKVSAALDTGVLQPDFLTHILWGEAMLDQLDPVSHLLIDGFPRTVVQAHVLDDALAFFERKSVYVINLETPEAVVRERMISRARTDDTTESIEERLRWYREDTLPVLDYYRARPDITVYDLDGTNNVEEVHKQVLSALDLS